VFVCDALHLAENVEMQSHGGAAATVRSRLFSKAKVKSLCMSAVIVAAFIICWTPYQVVFIVHTFVDMGDVEHRYVLWIFTSSGSFTSTAMSSGSSSSAWPTP